MNRATLTNLIHFNNILYIGDEAKTCIRIIEKFNNRLLEIEQAYSGWFENSSANDKLQHHIHYHFEGGIAAFKFKSEDNLPANIRNECFAACKTLAAEQFYMVS
jgi:hypothetical protein